VREKMELEEKSLGSTGVSSKGKAFLASYPNHLILLKESLQKYRSKSTFGINYIISKEKRKLLWKKKRRVGKVINKRSMMLENN